MPRRLRLAAYRMLVCGLAAVASAAAAAPVTISNTATMHFRDGGTLHSLTSNTIETPRAKGLPATVRFTRVPASFDGDLPIAQCQSAPSKLIDYDGDGLAEPPPSVYNDTRSYSGTSPVLIELTNPSGNADPGAIETAKVTLWSKTGDVEHLTLIETSADSGVFTGAIASSLGAIASEDCVIQTKLRSAITVDFDGDDTNTNDSTDTALIDPYGYVFNALTGELVDGVTVTLIDTDTGRPAAVFGDDGVSAYPSTVVSGQSVTDAGGGVYPGNPGQYRFPQIAAGHYRLQFATPPGYVAPSSVTADKLASLNGPNGAFVIDGSSYGATFTLDEVDPLQIDIPVDPASGALSLDKVASTRTASPGDVVQYRLRLVNRDGDVTARGVTISDVLPPGMRYRRGSTRGIADPDVGGDGRTLTFHPGAMRPGSALEIRYSVTIQPGAPIGEALNRAVAMNAAGERSAEGRASVRIQPLLNTDALTIVGRVTEGDCDVAPDRRKGIAGVRLLMEDGTYVVTDRDGLYHIEGARAGRHVVQLDTQGLPADLTPLDCARDTRQAGRAFSRFVEGGGGTLQRADFALRRDPAKAVAAEQHLTGSVIDDATAAGNGIDWLDGQAPGVDFLFPGTGHNPRAPVLRVVIKHLPGQAVALSLNGAPVDALARDQGDGNGSIVIAKWTGLPLKDGDNAIEAVVTDAQGHVVTTLHRMVHYANVAADVTWLRDRSVLVADGMTRPVIAVRLTDRAGKPVRAGTPVSFHVDQPYMAAVEADAQQARPLAGLDGGQPFGRVIGDDGVALIALQPTAQAGAVRMRFDFTRDGRTRTAEILPWLQAAARDWVVVGFGAGTAGHAMLSGKARRLQGLRRSESFTDGQIAFYAKGRIRGSWLLTMAYDSDRKPSRDRGLLSTIDPDRYYTVYGDRAQQGYDAATRGKLYLRLERRQFYALFGDYETGFNQTELTRFSRTLHGVKGEFRGRTVAFGGFAANSDDSYARDEIQGNGLSGPYRLRGRAIIPNSDKIRLETRDRLRSELIVDTRILSRHIDYDIDVDAGTLIFKAPVPVRDSAGNPVFIVAEYEQFGSGAKHLVAGGRASASFAKGRIKVGATLLRDESQGKAGLGGIDADLRITRTTSVRAEAAAGGRVGGADSRAFVAEVQHHADRTDLTAYVRQQDAGYGLGQQNAVEAGTRKYGADGRIRIGAKIALTASAWHQEALTGPAVRNAADIRAEWRGADTSFHAGVKIADDRSLANIDRSSRLVAIGGSRDLFDHKLIVAAENQFALGGADGSVDFPVRRTVDASWQVSEAVRLIGGIERAEGAKYSANAARVGFDVAPWAGVKLTSTVNQDRIAENGPRAYAQFGLAQSLPIGKRWSIDAAFDTSKTVKGRIPSADIVNPLHPVASVGTLGQDGNPNEDYRSLSLGATYRGDAWSWNGRAEQRTGDSSTRIGLSSAVLRQLGEGRTLGSTARFYRIRQKSGAVASLVSADLALAWRPLDSHWALLDRLELRREQGGAGVGSGNLLGVGNANGVAALSSRIVNNLALDYRSGRDGEHQGWEASLYHGVKYVRGKFDDDRFDGLIDVTGFDLRHSIGAHFDISVSASVQHGWKDRTIAYSAGPSVGVSPADNVWISVGYNVKGFRDRDFEQNRYLRQGPFVTMRLKFDQQSFSGMGRSLGKMIGR